MTYSSPSRWVLSFDGLYEPGSAAARSRPTDGFSAMTRVLLMLGVRRYALLSMGAGPSPDRPTGPRQRTAHDAVRHAEAAPLPPSDRRGEDGCDHVSPAVDHRTARVAGAHPAAQRRDLAVHRAAPVGVLGPHDLGPPEAAGLDVEGPVLREPHDRRRG